jgi:Kef-type K+ transport system membrane component KefB
MLDTVAWIGIFFLLLVTGLEVNFSSVWKHRGKAAWIAMSDIVIPIVYSAIILFFLPSHYLINPEQRFLFVFFISTIMTISAMPVSIRVMQDLKLLRTDLGFLTISALSINDIAGWIVFTIILGMFAHGSPDLSFVLVLVISTGLSYFWQPH